MLNELSTNQDDIIKNIQTFTDRFGFQESDVRKKIQTDNIFAAHFTKEPWRQGFHEKVAAEWIEEWRPSKRLKPSRKGEETRTMLQTTVFSPYQAWHFDPPTPRQIAFLQPQLAAVGESLPEKLTKGIASAMIAAIFDQHPATEKQKNYLRILGVEFDENVSKHEAMKLIDRAK